MALTQSRIWGAICPGGLLQFPHVSVILCLCAQVYRAKAEAGAGVLTPRMKSGTPSSSQLNLSVLERSPSPKVWLPGDPGPLAMAHTCLCQPPSPSSQLTTHCPAQGPPSPAGSLSRNLVATLQDIETKRQLALQQKGELWLCVLALGGGGTLGDALPAATWAMEKGAWPRVATAAMLQQDAVPLSQSLAFPPSLSS